jgi:hypothetical protein
LKQALFFGGLFRSFGQSPIFKTVDSTIFIRMKLYFFGETEASCFAIFDIPGGYVGNTRLKIFLFGTKINLPSQNSAKKNVRSVSW